MAFDRLTRLGAEKFQRVVNELVRGTPASLVARLIREWGDAQDVREETLSKQLRRLHTIIINGAFGGELAEQARKRASVRITLLHGSTLDCLDALINASVMQRERVLALRAKEQALERPLAALNVAVRDYRDLLLAIQKIKFDLGLDAYKRGIPTVTASDPGVTAPDVATQQQVREAYGTLDDIFARRGIQGERLP